MQLECKGRSNPVKRKKILNYLKKEQIHIAFLQETHLTDSEHIKLKRLGGTSIWLVIHQ